LLLLAQVAVSPKPVAASQPTTTVKLDGKTVFVPEIPLTKRVVPVTTVLFVGSWESAGRKTVDATPLCSLDLQNNRILLSSPEKLLANSTTPRFSGRNKVYVVKGSINSEKSSVWIEDADTGDILTSKIEKVF
jgi:hypothetical protein